MTVNVVRSMLLWCLFFNFGLLLSWFLIFIRAHDWLYKMHGKWFKLSAETFDAIHYAGMALFKICILVLNLVPYLALYLVEWM